MQNIFLSATSTLKKEHEKSDSPELGMSMHKKVFKVIALLLPDWYFDDRHTSDLPGLMRKVQATLDTPEMQAKFSFKE